MRLSKAKDAAVFLSLLGLTAIFVGCASQHGQQAAPQTPQPELAAIASIVPSQSEDGTLLTITADSPLTFSSLKQPDPLAVVLYLPNTSVDSLPAEQFVGGDLIQRISARGGNGSNTARIEIQLAADVPYKASQAGNQVLLTFAGPADAEPAVAIQAAVVDSQPPAVQTVSLVSDNPSGKPSGTLALTDAPQPAPIVKAEGSSDASGTIAWVNKVDFLSETEGKSKLVLSTTQPVDYQINKISGKKFEIRLLNTNIPSYQQRPLITTRFTSAVDRITPVQSPRNPNETLVSVELREAVAYFTEQVDNMLLVHFDASSIPPRPLEQAQLPDWQRAMSADQPSAMQPAVSQPGDLAAPLPGGPAPMPPMAGDMDAESQMLQEDAEIQAMLAPRKKVYTGEKIALDFYDTDIKNVFRILREVSGKNFAIDKDVTGKVTMSLDKPVPWDQVLDLVLRMNQLGMTDEGQIVRIATLETLKKEEDLRKAKLESLRKAKEEAKALEPMVTRYFPVSYSNAATDVQPHIEKILTPGRGSVTVDEKNNQIIVTDTVRVIGQAEEIIRRIDKVTSQVVIEARVVEVSDNFSKELGITWDMSYGPGTIPGLAWNTSTDMAMNFPTASPSSIGINFSRLSGVPFVLNARIDALETTGEGRILSSPKILTLDNKKAKIKQGVEYPYLERDSSGGSSVKFKNIDLLLEVTPHVTPDDRISLVIFITKNDVAGITAGVPSVATNEAQTELLVNDGDTVVIGGIIKATENKGENAFPLLGDIPILGWAFKNTKTTKQSNELLIFITPRIVQLEQAAVQIN
jgi:type IV pilus assembly protein PilQ